MSIDLSWSANSLQQPVHATLAALNRPGSGYSRSLEDQQARAEGRTGLLKLGRPLPSKGPWAQRAQDELNQQNPLMQQITAGFSTPEEKAWAAKHPDKAQNFLATKQAMGTLGTPVPPGWAAKHQQAVAKAGGASSELATQIMSGVIGDAVPKVTTPGINPAITTAVPQVKTDGVPKLAPVSGWMSPGGNFQIR